jgi:hypothetical protein
MKKSLFIAICVLLLIACDSSSVNYSADNSNGTGTGGSLARFTIAKDHLYTVDYNMLKVYDVTNELKPSKVKELSVGFDIQTIFSVNNILLMGSKWGVYIYDISDPANPAYLSVYNHTYSCDPVVVAGDYAYSTLSTSGACARGSNELDIIKISNPSSPYLIKSITMENPHGLGISGNLLFVCDNGIKVYNISNKEVPVFIKKIDIANAYDVIPLGSLLLVASDSGLDEYRITSGSDLVFQSSVYKN